MADRKLAHWQIASLTIIILIIPLIIVFQLTKADIVINFDDPKPFENKCFLGQSECTYEAIFPDIELREDETYWFILGEDVWCVKTERNVAEPVSDPVGVITEETEISCNNVAMFDKSEWDLIIIQAELIDGGETQSYKFTMKGT